MGRAATAIRGDTEAISQVGKPSCAGPAGLTDFAIGNGVADTDIHTDYSPLCGYE